MKSLVRLALVALSLSLVLVTAYAYAAPRSPRQRARDAVGAWRTESIGVDDTALLVNLLEENGFTTLTVLPETMRRFCLDGEKEPECTGLRVLTAIAVARDNSAPPAKEGP